MNPAGFEFRSSDNYSMVEEKLCTLFPRLFDWMLDAEPYDSPTSSWLICMKPPYRKNLVVYSNDQQLPTGLDIVTACQLAKSKSGIKDRFLYLGEPSALNY